MATIVTRAGKGSALTWTEGDANITNLNNDKIESVADDTTPQLGGTLDLNNQDITGTGNVTITGTVTADDIVGPLNGPVRQSVYASVALTKGDVVYFSGLQGNDPIASLAQSNSAATMPGMGIVSANIAQGSVGEIVQFGSLKGLDAADFGETGITFSLGDNVYISASEAGKLTNVQPLGESNLVQNIGKISRATPTTNITINVGGAGRTNATPNLDEDQFFLGNSSGASVAVDFSDAVNALLPTPVSSLNDLSDVSFSAPGATNGDVLIWNSVAGEFQSGAQSGGIANVVEDTTPQLGGTLDGQANIIQDVQLENYKETIYSLGSTDTPAIDVANGNVQTVTIATGLTLPELSNVETGQSVTLIVSGTGSITDGTVGSKYKFSEGNTSLTTNSIVSIFYDGTGYWASVATNFGTGAP
jgi:hypothetical protein